ncbi:S-adenosylmethionine:tRNA ribosyltransferase-isomerase [Bacteriovorax sp. BSW11_IV]|uniref:tRNA preQ1(34) S-adenosylmethionine ribosyltransferase-isomerase QueA n=1 Tax=Bacteriovorax sp. BSW11_IV TaxID=1353529 RepID=UPI00038A1379|nr:tRNA preQ1(34) S-adenosylmethionine ribosyltransferase-isomerase QueA [Bacteriovorax sp. BSW11_IV]EQC48514.1 S-adenosylmethionine:tRNA ribosyltransferase-isomerase [Bacteriovorax sp. BSW11_IV]
MMQNVNPEDLHLSNYDFDLPKNLIADRPVVGRHHSKLLIYNAKTNEIIHTNFLEIDKYLPSDSLLVANQSKVFPCRLLGQKTSGGKAEIFILSVVSSNNSYKALIKCRGKKNVGDQFILPHDVKATITSVQDGVFWLSFSVVDFTGYLEQVGKIPIPPYIRSGESDEKDKSDYQTVFAKNVGSVAAPTAGLHFTDEVFANLAKKNIERAFVTLHVGLGTFAPVKTDNLSDHVMHTEEYFIDAANLDKLNSKKKIIAVGTTSLRVLESSFHEGRFDVEAEKRYHTNIFLHPGKTVHSIDALITNFHLPKSTLLMLVSSLIGREKTLELYKEAITREYRFFSYGDAMLILR